MSAPHSPAQCSTMPGPVPARLVHPRVRAAYTPPLRRALHPSRRRRLQKDDARNACPVRCKQPRKNQQRGRCGGRLGCNVRRRLAIHTQRQVEGMDAIAGLAEPVARSAVALPPRRPAPGAQLRQPTFPRRCSGVNEAGHGSSPLGLLVGLRHESRPWPDRAHRDDSMSMSRTDAMQGRNRTPQSRPAQSRRVTPVVTRHDKAGDWAYDGCRCSCIDTACPGLIAAGRRCPVGRGKPARNERSTAARRHGPEPRRHCHRQQAAG